MLSETVFSNVSVNKLTKDKAFKTNIMCDIIIPDSKPDVLKVISVTAKVNLKETTFQKDKITFLGSVVYQVVYMSDSESDRIKSITYRSPFSHQAVCTEYEEDALIGTEVSIFTPSASIQNSRKISVSLPAEFKTYAVKNNLMNMADDVANNQEILHLDEKISVMNRAVCLNEKFSFEDSIVLSDCAASEIIRCDVNVRDREYKLISNKTVVKGSIEVSVVFFDQEGRIRHVSKNGDFSEVLDTQNISRDLTADISIDISDFTCSIGEDGVVIKLECDMCVMAAAYEEIDINLMRDAYCPKCKVNLARDTFNAFSLVAMGEERISLKEVSEFASGECNLLCTVIPNVRIKSQTIENSRLKTVGVISYSIVYTTEDSYMLCTDNTEREFESITDVANAKNSDFVRTGVYVSNCTFSLIGGNKVEICTELIMEHTVLREVCLEYITNVSPDKDALYDTEQLPGIIIYFVNEGDTLWNIAKKYHTTISEIVKVNELDANAPLKCRQKILIPSVR